jgi:hypothetical protein
VFKLQSFIVGLNKWVNVNEDFKARLPENVDVLYWLRKQFPATDFRIAYERKEKS